MRWPWHSIPLGCYGLAPRCGNCSPCLRITRRLGCSTGSPRASSRLNLHHSHTGTEDCTYMGSYHQTVHSFTTFCRPFITSQVCVLNYPRRIGHHACKYLTRRGSPYTSSFSSDSGWTYTSCLTRTAPGLSVMLCDELLPLPLPDLSRNETCSSDVSLAESRPPTMWMRLLKMAMAESE